MLPFGLIATPDVDPHFRPSGSCAQSRTIRYGLGRSFRGGELAWPCARVAQVASIAATTTPAVNFRRASCGIIIFSRVATEKDTRWRRTAGSLPLQGFAAHQETGRCHWSRRSRILRKNFARLLPFKYILALCGERVPPRGQLWSRVKGCGLPACRPAGACSPPRVGIAPHPSTHVSEDKRKCGRVEFEVWWL